MLEGKYSLQIEINTTDVMALEGITSRCRLEGRHWSMINLATSTGCAQTTQSLPAILSHYTTNMANPRAAVNPMTNSNNCRLI
jgi:hypothetical protein